jgi:hypothetical protein
MKYKKPIMRLTALRDEMGFPEEMLLNAYRTKGQTFAQKLNPLKKGNSPIIFDTEEFEKWRMKQLIDENKSLYK